MKTIVYLIRHSEQLKKINNIINNDNLQIQNEKTCLSIEGEMLASKISKLDELQNIDILFSSNYVRTISTAKYIANENNIKINIVEALGERKFGINNWNELPKDFEMKQFVDENYKIGNGESQKEVSNRMYNCLMEIIKECKGKRIAIVSHSTAILYLLKKFVDIDNQGNCTFEGTCFFNCMSNWNYCEIFKLEFTKNKLIKIENIKEN